MVASWPRWRSRTSSSPGPENVPVNDHLPGVVTDCPPARNLVVTMDRNGLLVDLTLALVRQGSGRHPPPAAGGRRHPRAVSQGEKDSDGLGGADAGAATGEPGTRATQGP
jgi:hypothetical protein